MSMLSNFAKNVLPWPARPLFTASIEIKRLNAWTALPSYKTPGSAGLDLAASLREELVLQPGETQLVPTGIAVNMGTSDMVGYVFPRSGKATKEGLIMANTVGVIDSDYQGEIMIAAWNRNRERTVTIGRGERIAQLVFMPIVRARLIPVEEFATETARGDGGFGSTGRFDIPVGVVGAAA